MSRAPSLERHLLVWTLGALSLGALLLVLACYVVTLDEMGEIFDDNLRQVALAEASHADLPDASRRAALQTRLPRIFEEQGDFDFAMVIRDAAGRVLYASDATLRLPPPERTGLARVGEGEQLWHVYTAVGDDRIVQVAQRAGSRGLLAAEAASKLFVPLLLMTALFALLLVIALRRGLRPLDVAAGHVAARSAVSLEPIATGGMPREIHPLIASLNGLMQRLAEAFQTQRRFIADAAHELRTPVTALRLQWQLLDRATDPAARAAATHELRLGIERAQHLIGQLLDLSRAEPDAPTGAKQPMDLAEAVRAAALRHSAEADARGIDLGAEAPAPVPVDADAPQIAVLLDNLVGNALRYTPRGGRVDVAADSYDGRPRLRVADTGPGIPAHERERVFDRFHRGEDAAMHTEGSGLGLSIVRAIADRHGAVVELGDGAAGGLVASVAFPPPSRSA